MESTTTARSPASALADLQQHWGGAYEIGLDGDIWSATYRGTADELRAHTPVDLRVLIRADYSYRQAWPAPQLPPAPAPAAQGPDAGGDTRPGSAGGYRDCRGERMSL